MAAVAGARGSALVLGLAASVRRRRPRLLGTDASWRRPTGRRHVALQRADHVGVGRVGQRSQSVARCESMRLHGGSRRGPARDHFAWVGADRDRATACRADQLGHRRFKRSASPDASGALGAASVRAQPSECGRTSYGRSGGSDRSGSTHSTKCATARSRGIPRCSPCTPRSYRRRRRQTGGAALASPEACITLG